MFKLNQTVWCVIYGKGVVANISQESGAKYPVLVKFGDHTTTYNLDGKFHKLGNVVLFPYPVEVVKSIVRPSINWAHVNEKFKWLAYDLDGSPWVYEYEPTAEGTSTCWRTSKGDTFRADRLTSYVPGTCDWKDSLVERPKGETT